MSQQEWSNRLDVRKVGPPSRIDGGCGRVSDKLRITPTFRPLPGTDFWDMDAMRTLLILFIASLVSGAARAEAVSLAEGLGVHAVV